MLFISDSRWRELRNSFSENERQRIRAAMALTHQGFNIDMRKLDEPLQEKLICVLLEATPAIRKG